MQDLLTDLVKKLCKYLNEYSYSKAGGSICLETRQGFYLSNMAFGCSYAQRKAGGLIQPLAVVYWPYTTNLRGTLLLL